MQRPQRVARERKMLLAVVAVASGVTISCSSAGIGLYNPGWDAAFEDAAKDAAHNPFADASSDSSSDAEVDASDDASDAASD